RNPAALGIVAEGTGKPEILLFSQASERLRDEVIQLHGRADDGLRRQAVPTAVSCLGGDLDAQCLRDARPAHDVAARSERSCPRSFKIAAARARISIDRSYCETSSASLRASVSDRLSLWRLICKASSWADAFAESLLRAACHNAASSISSKRATSSASGWGRLSSAGTAVLRTSRSSASSVRLDFWARCWSRA